MDYITQQHIKWFGQMMRMSPSLPDIQVYNSRCSGSRKTRQQWIDSVSDILHVHGITLHQASHLTLDHQLQFPMTLHGTSGRPKQTYVMVLYMVVTNTTAIWGPI